MGEITFETEIVDHTAFIEGLVLEVAGKHKAALREALHSAYSHGRADALAPILRAAGVDPATKVTDIKLERVAQGKAVKSEVKVPRGLPDAFIARVMQTTTSGLSPTTIIPKYAHTAEERAISYSALRKALQRGRKLGLYDNKRGKWFKA